MPMPTLTVPQYPQVPNLPGVPPLVRSVTNAIAKQAALVNSRPNLPQNATEPVWGIFTPTGAPLVVAESVLGVRLRKEMRVPDYPMEQGAFRSYNKVQMPFDALVKLALGGDSAARAAFLTQIGQLVDSLDLCAVVTPEATYQSANIVHFDYSREAHQGAGMIVVDLWVREIRLSGSAIGSNSKSASGTKPVNGGTVQSTAPTSVQSSAAVGVR